MKWLLLSLVSSFAFAGTGDFAPLDPRVPEINPIREEMSRANLANDMAYALQVITPVRTQGKRGTCSIFSTTAIVEAILKIQEKRDFDLSENYLEFLAQTRMKSMAAEGSDVPYNVPALQRYGTVLDETWPYEEYDWTAELPDEEQERADATCGMLAGNPLKACLLTHMDPRQDRFAQSAAQLGNQYGLSRLVYTRLASQNQIRQILDGGYPVIESVEFFYAAWNHRLMPSLGLGERDMAKWRAGVVGAPSARDIQISRQHPAGHSIMIVGYDDLKRVYYFKNSWGTDGFGAESHISGATAGYGEMSYDYAHRYGTFYDVYKMDSYGRPIRRQ